MRQKQVCKKTCENCGSPLEAVYDGTNFLFYLRCSCTRKASKFVPRGFENTRYSTDVCLKCGRIVRRELKPDGACPNCGNKTEWKHERLYYENDT